MEVEEKKKHKAVTQTKGENMKEIRECPFSKDLHAVSDPEVVKIRVMKRKHLDGIREAKLPPMESGKILGYTGAHVIFRIECYHHDGPIHHLLKVRDVDLISYTLAQRQREKGDIKEWRLTQEEADAIKEEVWLYLTESMHQLFVE